MAFQIAWVFKVPLDEVFQYADGEGAFLRTDPDDPQPQ
jgi:hypothetical protein